MNTEKNDSLFVKVKDMAGKVRFLIKNLAGHV
jgi:hypothetical protein